MDKVTLHAVFPPVTDFQVAFKDRAVRDSFNKGLSRLCRDGNYVRLLSSYEVRLQKTICD